MIERSRFVAVQINHGASPVSSGRSGLIGLVVVLLGVILIVKGTVPSVRFRLWRSKAVSAMGEIVENVPIAGKRDATWWSPIVQFRCSDAVVLALLAGSARADAWPLGGAVEVLYDPLDPHHARLADTRFGVATSVLAGLSIIGIFLAVTA